MNATQNITTLFSILLLLAGTAWFVLTNVPKVQLNLPTDTPEHRFTALEVQQFDKTGAQIYHLKSPSTYHMPDKDTHHLNTPHIFVTKANQPDWTIQAQKALVTPKALEIKFLDQVMIHHDAYEDQAAGVLKTEAISYFPKKKLAHTPLKITWDQDDNHLEAIGMQANLITHHIELLENIRGTYRPRHG
ncbi:MAG: LPS export ABC transporter periplasmic protein LptC [Gammaproteobacteria bacterium]|nr:LPS export ABC transporter periplasmic protein LptC [Gammaproteobacteria bacterium]